MKIRIINIRINFLFYREIASPRYTKLNLMSWDKEQLLSIVLNLFYKPKKIKTQTYFTIVNLKNNKANISRFIQ